MLVRLVYLDIELILQKIIIGKNPAYPYHSGQADDTRTLGASQVGNVTIGCDETLTIRHGAQVAGHFIRYYLVTTQPVDNGLHGIRYLKHL